ncbi:hypothetical protein J4E82_004829 [Alternaria postmessia]|uniref:uncharacterized protein n=1 Tax=Alternaria postmessia TaxID=1187938 RepID=UPI0022248E91|nr:uncharacterized protein J4E82_004829 [Alternaria postmessia]KAI5376335.1 hypothetical protein J4E82_004829 [Alternaria postmessia]
MSSPIVKQDHENPHPEALCISTTRKRYRDPLVVFVVVLTVLLGLRCIYNPFAATSLASIDNNDLDIQTVDTYDENQLQEVATLMEEIYTVLAKTSFIPHDSIERGPHQINTTASPCKLDAADFRLMEILPYVNTSLSGHDSWLWGGTFIDFRKDRDLNVACDASWVEDDFAYVIRPGIVHLTEGGWEDRDHYRTWKLQYDTRKHMIRVYEGEEWWPYSHRYKGAFREIKDHKDNPDDLFNIYHGKRKLRQYEDELKDLETGNLTDGPSLWRNMLFGGSLRREVGRQESDFEDAKQLIQRLCSNGVCVQEDLILWEFRKLENTYTKAQLEPNATIMCEQRELHPDLLSRCISQLNLERYWLQLAYQQSRADAYAYCAQNSKHLLPPASFEALASHWIAKYESYIAEYDHVPAELDAWQERTGAPDSTVEFLRKQYDSAKAWDTRLNEGRIEEIVRSLAGSDGDEARLKLWNNLEFTDEPRSMDYYDDSDKVFY